MFLVAQSSHTLLQDHLWSFTNTDRTAVFAVNGEAHVFNKALSTKKGAESEAYLLVLEAGTDMPRAQWRNL